MSYSFRSRSAVQQWLFAMAVALAANNAIAAEPATIDQIMAGSHRSETNRARDVFRHPKETLAFFGVKPDSTVIEVWPGAAWYTEILAPHQRDKGRYIAAFPAQSVKGLQSYKDKLAKHPEVYDRATIVPLGVPDKLNIRPEGGADFVLTFRNVHNWIKDEWTDKFFAAFFDALKPGGVMGLTEHRAKPGTTLKQSIDSGYVDEAWVIARAEAAGFRLDAKSEINANPKDTKDYAKGVWTLPPSLTNGETDKAKYLAIGESDRMTLRFVKPLK